ncbi:VOC family protein [Nocardioides sp. B-3]|uniref:VOC family protein n=1 Tax=Nocardioides sp. B-3 TaxID=2895565 RepID=UPI00215202CE|nr:VOC family protein [Nocardioides sp. B-3]UUZ60097.1 glyoxalase/bleomycin resistance/dioxygenase family protein [Nocardioides sp. B-3]
MHRSRIAVVMIDQPEESFDAAAGFWAGAQGATRAANPDPPYESLHRLPGNVALELQRTGSGTPPRIHLDLETDDIAAEVSRLEALSATVVERADGWVVMADPGGLLLCVVPVWTDRADFDRHATTRP